MARPRYQRGFVEETGKRIKKWKVHWYVWTTGGDGTDERHHRNRIVGRRPGKAEGPLNGADAALPLLSRDEAQAVLDRIIREEAGGQSPHRDGAVSFGDFALNRWLPLRESTWRRSTKITNMAVLNKHLAPRWGKVRLDSIDATAAAAWLGKIAETYSPSMVHKIRTYLRAIVSEAVEQGYLQKDPLRRLRKPQARKRKDRSFLTAGEVQSLRDNMNGFRDRLILDILLVRECGRANCSRFAGRT